MSASEARRFSVFRDKKNEIRKVEDLAGTAAFAREFAREALETMAALGSRSLVVALEGDLGAGKTAFVQAVAAELGVSRPVTSPTFCLVSEYQTKGDAASAAPPKLVHMDLYRLRGEDDVLAIGWEDYLAEGALVMVEWPGRAGELIPPDAWRMEIVADGETARTFTLTR